MISIIFDERIRGKSRKRDYQRVNGIKFVEPLIKVLLHVAQLGTKRKRPSKHCTNKSLLSFLSYDLQLFQLK